MSRSMAFALLATMLLALSSAVLFVPGSDADAKVTYYQQDGVVRITLDEPLPTVNWGGEILNSDGTLYWESILVAFGGEEEVFLKEAKSRILYDIPNGTYTINLYPKSGSFDDVTATMVVQNSHPDTEDGSSLVIAGLAVVLVAVIGVAAFLLIRRRKR